MSTAALEHETITDTRTHHVYRMFDAAGVLLYVGISVNFGERLKQHRADKAWWSEVEHWTVEDAPSRADALFLDQLVEALHAANELNGKLLQEKDQHRIFVVESPCVAHRAAAPAPDVEQLPERQGIFRRIRRSFPS